MDINEVFQRLGELLSNGDFGQVEKVCDGLLSKGYTNPEIYLVRLLAEAKVKSLNELEKCSTDVSKCLSYKEVIRTSTHDIKQYVLNCGRNKSAYTNFSSLSDLGDKHFDRDLDYFDDSSEKNRQEILSLKQDNMEKKEKTCQESVM